MQEFFDLRAALEKEIKKSPLSLSVGIKNSPPGNHKTRSPPLLAAGPSAMIAHRG
jgi:hypothetical protein